MFLLCLWCGRCLDRDLCFCCACGVERCLNKDLCVFYTHNHLSLACTYKDGSRSFRCSASNCCFWARSPRGTLMGGTGCNTPPGASNTLQDPGKLHKRMFYYSKLFRQHLYKILIDTMNSIEGPYFCGTHRADGKRQCSSFPLC